MSEVLIVLSPTATPQERNEVARLAPPVQSISPRVFIAQVDTSMLSRLRAAAGAGHVLTGTESAAALPDLDPAESLFANAWLSNRGQTKQRPGDGLDWDTPPMLPPDGKPVK